MAKIPFKCDNVQCRYHSNTNKKGCSYNGTIFLDCNGCTIFEKGYIYYINLVWNLIKDNKVMFLSKMNKDICIGLYLIIILFDLTLKEVEEDGVIGYILLDKYDYPQDYDSIISRQINFDALRKILDFEEKSEIANMLNFKKQDYKSIKDFLNENQINVEESGNE